MGQNEEVKTQTMDIFQLPDRQNNFTVNDRVITTWFLLWSNHSQGINSPVTRKLWPQSKGDDPIRVDITHDADSISLIFVIKKDNFMGQQPSTPPETEVDIEQIMQQIRKQILTKKAALSETGKPIVPISGKRLPPEFYEHLYHAALANNQVRIKMHVTRVPLPILGPLIEGIRSKVHALVIFYVNQIADQQAKVNTHLLQALGLLSQELEEGTGQS
jgi:hypothetical protein